MGTLLRLFFLRFLPRRLVPIFFAWDAYQLYKNRHRYYQGRGEELPRNATPRNVTPRGAKARRQLW